MCCVQMPAVGALLQRISVWYMSILNMCLQWVE